MIAADEFIHSVPFIIFFLLMVLIIKITVGEKVVIGFLFLVLASMILINPALLEGLAEKIKF